MKRMVLMGIKKPDDHKTSVLWIIRLFGGSPCGPIARYVPGYQGIGLSKYLNTRGGCSPFELLVHDVNAIASFPVGHAPILYDRNSHNLAALWAFERDLKRLVCVVKSCGVECPLSTFGAPHGNIHRNSSCCMSLATELT